MLGFVIGNEDLILGFRLVGVEGIEVTTPEEAKAALQEALKRSSIAIIIISEQFSSLPGLQDAINKARGDRVTPMIVEVPSSQGKQSKVNMLGIITKTLGVRM